MRTKGISIFATLVLTTAVLGLSAQTATATPNWIFNGQFLLHEEEALDIELKGTITFGPFAAGAEHIEFTCETKFKNTVIGGKAGIAGSDRMEKGQLAKCAVKEPANCTIDMATLLVVEPANSGHWPTELVFNEGNIFDEIKNVEFRGIKLEGGMCSLNGGRYRGLSKNYRYLIKNLPAGIMLMEIKEGKDTFENEETKASSEGAVKDTEEATPPEGDTLEAGTEPLGELVNKEGKALMKNKFTAKSGETLIETTGGSSIKCKSASTTGTIASTTAGEETVSFKECKTNLGVSCKSSGESSGTIKLALSLSVAADRSASSNDLFVAAVKGTPELECTGVKVKIKGSFAVQTPKQDTLATAYTFAPTETKGIQAPSEFENLKGEKVKDVLEAEIASGKLERAGQQEKQEVIFEESAEFV
jgi:hypothetical protein